MRSGTTPVEVKEGKSAVVLGAGESGLWAVKLLSRRGFNVSCSSNGPILKPVKAVFAKLGVRYEENGHTPGFLSGADWVVPSPGVKPSSAPLRWASARAIPVRSELEIAAGFVRGKWIAVTGTNGKTTTCSLVHHILASEGPCDLCGNIGKSLSRSVFQKPSARRVVEVSSFQLHYSSRVRPNVGVILNLKPNHLDWHKNLSEYYADKLRLLACMRKTGTAVLNADDRALTRRAAKVQAKIVWFSLRVLPNGFYREGDSIIRAENGRRRVWLSLKKAKLKGDHNVMNMLAAAAACQAFGASRAAVQRGIDTFRPLRHRIEPVGTAAGVTFINDSKSTTLESTRAALESLDRDAVLLAGGRAKEKDYSAIVPILNKKVSSVVLYGEAGRMIASQINGFKKKRVVRDFRKAVETAFGQARRGGVVLLSPMCSSFDQFSSYVERGEAFRRIVRELKQRHG